MPPTGLEPAVTSNERPQTLALDLSATGIGILCIIGSFNSDGFLV